MCLQHIKKKFELLKTLLTYNMFCETTFRTIFAIKYFEEINVIFESKDGEYQPLTIDEI